MRTFAFISNPQLKVTAYVYYAHIYIVFEKEESSKIFLKYCI